MRIFGYEDVKQYNKNKYRLYMKFIVDTYDLETSADMLEVILENEYAYPIKVRELNKNKENIID